MRSVIISAPSRFNDFRKHDVLAGGGNWIRIEPWESSRNSESFSQSVSDLFIVGSRLKVVVTALKFELLIPTKQVCDFPIFGLIAHAASCSASCLAGKRFRKIESRLKDKLDLGTTMENWDARSTPPMPERQTAPHLSQRFASHLLQHHLCLTANITTCSACRSMARGTGATQATTTLNGCTVICLQDRGRGEPPSMPPTNTLPIHRCRHAMAGHRRKNIVLNTWTTTAAVSG